MKSKLFGRERMYIILIGKITYINMIFENNHHLYLFSNQSVKFLWSALYYENAKVIKF